MTKGKILVVGDEIRLCRIIEEFFNKRGYDIKSVCSGTKAIELIKKKDLTLCYVTTSCQR